MYVVCARLIAKEGHEGAIVDAMRHLVPASRGEPGCLAYVAHRDVADPSAFMFYEQYVDEDAYKAHQATEHYQRWAAGVIGPAVASRERAIYTEVA